MIEAISGKVAALTPATVELDTASGVAFLLNITLPTFTELQGKNEARLLVHEHIREDAYTLYGFLNDRERSLFRALIGVSGVGAGTARIILSSIAAADLEQVIANGEEKKLKNVKGVGQKTAQRIIVDLKDKIKPIGDTLLEEIAPNSEAYDETLTALVVLGFQKPACQKVLKKLFEADPAMKVEAAVRKALTML